MNFLFFFFFSSRRRHTRFDCDWSSDVCSSDLSRNRLEQTAVNARATAASRRSARSCDRLRIPVNRAWLFSRGATTLVRKTSNSRAGPSSPVSHFSSRLMSRTSACATISENNDIAAQASQPDAHLMDALGVSGKDCRFVGDYLLETGKSNRSERGARRDARRNVKGFASRDRGILAGEKFVAALRLAFDGKFAGGRACDCSRELEQSRSIASLQLELCFTQR